MKKAIMFLGCLLGLSASSLFAQQGITASGGEATGSGGKVSYSVGQIDYTYSENTTYNVSAGVQQIFELPTGIEKTNISLAMYPNPTSENLTLNIENQELTNLTFSVTDMSGRLISSKRIESNKTTIAVSDLSNGQYIISINDKNQLIKSYKFIKN